MSIIGTVESLWRYPVKSVRREQLDEVLPPPRRLAGRQGHLAQLDGLRALAVTSVAWSHWAPGRYSLGLPLGTGVQLFFVLSGFLISGILLDAKAGEPNQSVSGRFAIWRSFYARRFLRIFPLYYAVLMVTFLLGVSPITHTWKWHVTYLSNFFYVQQGGWGHMIDPFQPFWSLAVEEQFYLVWPFLILLLTRRTLLKVLIGMILIAPVFRITMYWMGVQEDMIHLLPFSCMDSLGIGSLFAYMMRYPIGAVWQADRVSRLCLLLGLPGCVGFALLERISHGSFVARSIGHFWLVLFYGWIVCWAATGSKGLAGLFLQSRPIAYVGKISYGLYVFHLFAILAIPAIASQIGLGETLAASVPLKVVSNALFTMILAMASWHLFEAPINKLKRYFPYTSKPKALDDPQKTFRHVLEVNLNPTTNTQRPCDHQLGESTRYQSPTANETERV